MKLGPTHLALAGTLCLASACGSQRTAAGSQIKLTMKPEVTGALHGVGGAPALCGTFHLTPYSFNAAHRPVLAGAPVTFTTSSASTAIDQILGCVAGPKNFAYIAPAVHPGSNAVNGSYNWAYLVSADTFTNCSTGLAIPPDTVNASPAYFAPVNCVAGVDENLDIDYPISISAAAPGGYVDISAGVDATTQYVACKTAEIIGTGTSAELRFGQSFAIDSIPQVPLGLVGFTAGASDNQLAQYGGQVSATDPNHSPSVLYNTFLTGQFASSPTRPSKVFQTFLASFDAGHAFSFGDGLCTGGEWVDSRHAYCLTTNADATSPVQPTTVGKLADAFLYLPGAGYAAASVTSSTTITLYSQMVANSPGDYTSGSPYPVVTANAAGGFSSTATTSPMPAGAGFNDGLGTILVSAPTGLTFTGLYVDPAAPGQFLVGAFAPSSGVNSWGTLSWNGAGATPAWVLIGFTDLAAGLPRGFGGAASGCLSFGPGFHPTGNWSASRAFDTATRLLDGTVLMTGGSDSAGAALASAQIYDPGSNGGAFSATGSLVTARDLHTATLLPSGEVLVVGGSFGSASLASAELYSPAVGGGSFAAVAAYPGPARSNHTATFFATSGAAGKVLIAGGRNADNSDVLSGALLYDPAGSGTFSTTGPLNQARSDFTATRLADDKVLIVGGLDNSPLVFNPDGTTSGGPTALASAELYDPATGAFAFTSSAVTPFPRTALNNARAYHTATLLPGGQVLIAGGQGADGVARASAELYEPATGLFTSTTGPLLVARAFATATILPNGKVLIAGGQDASGLPLASAELYDPATGRFTSTGSLGTERFLHTATLLNNGRVLIAGGYNSGGLVTTAELYY